MLPPPSRFVGLKTQRGLLVWVMWTIINPQSNFYSRWAKWHIMCKGWGWLIPGGYQVLSGSQYHTRYWLFFAVSILLCWSLMENAARFSAVLTITRVFFFFWRFRDFCRWSLVENAAIFYSENPLFFFFNFCCFGSGSRQRFPCSSWILQHYYRHAFTFPVWCN